MLVCILSTDKCNYELHREIRLNEGAVQLCVRHHPYNYFWRYITTEGWTNTAARVACRELGYPAYSGKYGIS